MSDLNSLFFSPAFFLLLLLPAFFFMVLFLTTFFYPNSYTSFDTFYNICIITHQQIKVLFQAEEVSDPFYILLDGEIELLEPPPQQSFQEMQSKVYRTRRHKQTVYMTLEGPCAVCMETFFIQEPRPCTARGSKSCQLLSLQHDALLQCLKTDSEAWNASKLHQNDIEEELKKMSLVKTMKKNLSSAKLMKMQQMTKNMESNSGENTRRMFHPHSKCRQFWAFVMMFIVMLDFLSFPARLAFDTPMKIQVSFVILGTLLDLLHCVDVYLNLCRFSIIKEDGVVLQDVPSIIRLQSKSTAMYLRLLAALPLQLLLFYGGGIGGAEYSSVMLALTRLPKLFVLFQASGNEIESILEKWDVKMDSSMFRTFKMSGAVLIVTHYIACTFLCVPSWQYDHDIDGGPVFNASPMARYIAAAYWSAYTMSTVGYGDIFLHDAGSLLFAMAVSLLGVVLCGAGLTALFTYWIDGLDQASGLTRLKQKCVDMYMCHYEYTGTQRMEIQQYLAYMSNHQKSIEEQYALSLLPSSLRADIIVHYTFEATRSLLAKQQWTSNGLLRSLCIGMQPYMASTMEELITLEQPMQRLYVLVQGRVQRTNHCSSGNDTIVLIPEKTAFGGDFGAISNFTAISIENSHLFYVTKKQYDRILKFVTGARRSSMQFSSMLQHGTVLSNCRRGSSFSGKKAINQLSKFAG